MASMKELIASALAVTGLVAGPVAEVTAESPQDTTPPDSEKRMADLLDAEELGKMDNIDYQNANRNLEQPSSVERQQASKLYEIPQTPVDEATWTALFSFAPAGKEAQLNQPVASFNFNFEMGPGIQPMQASDILPGGGSLAQEIQRVLNALQSQNAQGKFQLDISLNTQTRNAGVTIHTLEQGLIGQIELNGGSALSVDQLQQPHYLETGKIFNQNGEQIAEVASVEVVLYSSVAMFLPAFNHDPNALVMVGLDQQGNVAVVITDEIPLLVAPLSKMTLAQNTNVRALPDTSSNIFTTLQAGETVNLATYDQVIAILGAIQLPNGKIITNNQAINAAEVYDGANVWRAIISPDAGEIRWLAILGTPGLESTPTPKPANSDIVMANFSQGEVSVEVPVETSPIETQTFSREQVLELNESYAEALAELGQDWPVYQDGVINMVNFSPEEFYIVADELRFIQNGREFIWTPKTGWLMEQFRTDNGLAFYLSMQFLDSKSREAIGVRGTGLEDLTYPVAVIPGDGIDMHNHPEEPEYDVRNWEQIINIYGNHEVSSVPGIPAIAKAVDYTWYTIYTYQTNQPALSFDEFIAKFRSGQANFNISFNGQELLITPETKLQFRAAPNSRDVTSNEYVNSAGEIVNLTESTGYRDWFVNQDIVGLLWDIYKNNVPSQDEMLFAYELMQVIMPVTEDGLHHQAPAALIDANGNIINR